MANHVLTATDAALKAFFTAANISGLPAASIARSKESTGKTLPVLICNSETAVRKRAKNWEVTGSILLKTDPSTDENGDNLAASSIMEAAVLDALESNVDEVDDPHGLANAITAAGVADGSVIASEFLITAFFIKQVSAGWDEDEIFTFSVDYNANVIA